MTSKRFWNLDGEYSKEFCNALDDFVNANVVEAIRETMSEENRPFAFIDYEKDTGLTLRVSAGLDPDSELISMFHETQNVKELFDDLLDMYDGEKQVALIAELRSLASHITHVADHLHQEHNK